MLSPILVVMYAARSDCTNRDNGSPEVESGVGLGNVDHTVVQPE